MGGKARGKLNGELRRVQFDKRERAEALRLATAAMEAQNAYTDYLDARLLSRGIVRTEGQWSYEPLAGVAARVR